MAEDFTPPPGRFDDEFEGEADVVDIKTRKPRKGRGATPPVQAGQHQFDMGDHVEIGRYLDSDLRAIAPTTYTEAEFYRYVRECGVYKCIPESELHLVVQGYSGSPVENSGKRLSVRMADIKSGVGCAADRMEDRRFFSSAAAGITFLSSFVRVAASGITQEEHSEEQRSRFAYPFAYRADAEPERLLALLKGAFRDDVDADKKIALLQEHVGMALIGEGCRYQKALLLVGAQGANGKSTVQSVMKEAMPVGSTVSIAPHDMGVDYDRAQMVGKRLNIVSEVEQRELSRSEPWKAMIDGKNELKARSPYKDVIFFTPTAAHLYSCNKPPDTSDQSGGFWRRWEVIEFNRSFAVHEQVADLDRIIVAEELPAVVSWLLRGAQRALQQGRYTVPESSAVAIEKWRQSADQVACFVAEQCERLGPDDRADLWTPHVQLFKAYTNWASLNNYKGTLTSRRFTERMEFLRLTSKRVAKGYVYPVMLTYGE
ncbi:MAG TPA: phage/plasmid primase, P4 family [Gemmatimonadales bacterium]|nr:phage/plasmid primase, P4 family [Gemmatimonadales bacterium]